MGDIKMFDTESDSKVKPINARSKRHLLALKHINDPLYLVFSEAIGALDTAKVLTKAALGYTLKYGQPVTYAEIAPESAAFVAERIYGLDDVKAMLKSNVV